MKMDRSSVVCENAILEREDVFINVNFHEGLSSIFNIFVDLFLIVTIFNFLCPFPHHCLCD